MAKQKTFSKDVKHLYTETYFMENATGHDEFRNYRGEYDQLIDKFKMVINRLDLGKSDKLLDIGCGRGEIVIFHSLNGGNGTGVDFSGEAIKIAEEKAREVNARCTFKVQSFEQIDENEKYDKIISIDFIEHIASEEGIVFFRKCCNLLNPGGRLLIYTFPNTIRRRYGYKLIRFFSIIKGKPLPEKESDTLSDHYKQYHLNEQSYLSLKRSADRAGFRKVRIEYYDPSLNESAIKKILVHTPLKHIFLKGLTLIAYK